MEIYETKVTDFYSRFESSCAKLKSLENECETVSDKTPPQILQAIQQNLLTEYDLFKNINQEFSQYLTQTGTEISIAENYSLSTKYSVICDMVESCLDKVNSLYGKIVEMAASVFTSKAESHTGSIKSKTSSRRSKTSTMIAAKQAKAEAAKVKYEFSEKEALLKLQQSELEEQEQIAAAAAARKKTELQIQLKLLEEKKAITAAQVEVDVLESSLGSARGGSVKLRHIPEDDPKVRTAEFVTSQIPYYQTAPPLELNPSVPAFVPREEQPIPEVVNQNPTVLYPQQPVIEPRQSQVTYSPHIPPAIPQQETSSQLVNDFSKFLLKKDLLLSRLSVFNEKPENYMVWKISFKCIMADLNVSSFEELDLLVKWVGPDSSNQVLNIRAAHANNPKLGLEMAWERLDNKFGCPEMVEESLKKKLRNFPRLSNKDNKKLYDLADLVSEIEAVKRDSKYSSILGYYDSSTGVTPIVNKLPFNLREKWVTRASNYKKEHCVTFPPFTVFCSFVRDMSKIRNDPSLCYDTSNSDFTSKVDSHKKEHIISRKTEVSNQKVNSVQQNKCPLHKTNHSLNNCRAFRQKPFEERKKWLKEKGYCFKCCDSTEHKSKDCKMEIKCSICDSTRHSPAMHIDKIQVESPRVSLPSLPLQGEQHQLAPSLQSQGGERPISAEQVSSKCTQICGDNFQGKSCAKTILVKVYPKNDPHHFIRTYALLDDQSNRTLARSDFFNLLAIESNQIKYTMSSCTGTKVTSGQIADGYIVESFDGHSKLELPSILECNEIPNIPDEIPTPDVARHHSHLRDIADSIPALETQTPILLLIGRDLPEAHHVYSQLTGPKGSPYAQKLSLGWVIVGETCLGKIHKSDYVNVNKTYLLPNGRASHFQPCTHEFVVTQKEPSARALYHNQDQFDSVFDRQANDNKPALSVEDRHFIHVMDNGFIKGPDGGWSAPLPFRMERPTLPNNRELAIRRAKMLDASLRKNAVKREHFVNFMGKIIENGHAEIAPPLQKDEECWFLPVFGIYHPQKPGEIRCVFDSSAKCNGVSLNSVLLQGPDLTNNLLGILLRFRRENIAVAADIQQMFYSFRVHKEHRNYLRFFWYENNDPEKSLIEYRMCVHVFGNSPSPAVATYGLRRTVENSDHDVNRLVNRDFYVDDALTSLPTSHEAVDLLKRTQTDLQTANLKLHKVVSNSHEVLTEFPSEQRAKSLKDLDLTSSELPVQRTLGLHWNLSEDAFYFDVSEEQKPYTKRGVLSTINSLFDPIGFLSPITIEGKLILRDVMSEVYDWDDPLPRTKYEDWSIWRDSLPHLRQVHIPRCYSPKSLCDSVRIELHTFSDASETAIAAASYLFTCFEDGSCYISFAMGKAKVAPVRGHTIPRLELCAAVLASEIAETVKENLDVNLHAMKYYTDSKVVLGYIYNQSRRFYTYVCNRVDKIRAVSNPNQWNYVPTHLNPADDGSRGLKVSKLQHSQWLVGPQFLLKQTEVQDKADFPLIHPEEDDEIRKTVKVLATNVFPSTLGTERFVKFSSWKRLVRSVACLCHIAASYHGSRNRCSGWHICEESHTVQQLEASANLILKEIQQEVYGKEIQALRGNKPIPKNSSVVCLNPFIGSDGIMRVGGRLRHAVQLISREKHPVILPGKHHIAKLLAIHFHEEVQHQGRHFTEGAIRSGGFWLTGGKRLVASIIFSCAKCRKLRRNLEGQKMADLPSDRLEEAPPFTYVGVDAFGPWSVVTRRTRGGQANSKRWALLFTCLCIRAVHIEVIEDLSASAFINALRRFVAIRGKVKQFRSDRGTNFVGATSDLRVDAINVEDEHVKKYMYNSGTVWIFNTPHSSHMGGVWERLIGVARRILDSMLRDIGTLTHEVLVTLMAEVTAIINSRPLVPVSYDQEFPEILCPTTLLTHKTDMDQQLHSQIDVKDMFRSQWKRVQHLADTFWLRWKREYLQTLQPRKKWLEQKNNVQVVDIVLMRDCEVGRISWPVAKVERIFPSDDGCVRKVEVKVIKDGKPVHYIRPIVEIVLLFSPRSLKHDNHNGT